MSRLSLRGIQNREAVEEDLRANKQVFERQLKQVNLMGEQLKPATTDEVVLGDTIEKFVNAMLNKLENLNIIVASLNETRGSIKKVELRKDFNVAPLIVDWNMVARSYINPANTKKQRDTIIQTIMKLSSPVNQLIELIKIELEELYFILENRNINNNDVESIRLANKLLSFLELIKVRLDGEKILPIQKGDIESQFLLNIKRTPFRQLFSGSQYEILNFGEILPAQRRELFEGELEDPDEEDAQELGVDVLDNEEEEAVDFNMPVLAQEQQREEQPEIYEGFYDRMFGYGLSRPEASRKNRNNRIKFMAGPLDYNYERNDPYGNYRLE